ncbi:MAG: endonuclease/exonuclease/phosphatase family protein [Candidatus Thiodiazotropha endolucinida]|nr:endonuclease/exonuclease/phosphatase family protein [Candidatus Thiodiazotropha taylori]MCW4264991.1 endonuclease/exonuclease/phosphatase family protein [Candidatus Thiodiazotropha endolucinida]
MAHNTITFVSMNCQGLSGAFKRADTLNFLRSKKYSIYFLQDTHFTDKEENYIRTQWGFECYFSNFTSQSRGVAILFNNNFEFSIHNIIKDNNGNKLILDITIEGKRLTLINIYGPNRDSPEFYNEIFIYLKNNSNPVIMAGDFNLVLDPGLDMKNYLNVNNPKAREEILNLILECNLVDCWRELNIETYQYTWRKKNTNKQARLDFFLISESLFMDVIDAKIVPGYKTDHSLIFVSLKFGKFSPGKSFWKFNNSLLKDQLFVTEVKTVIEDTKTNYWLRTGNNNSTPVNEIPVKDLQLSIDDQLFFDVLLMEIRGI